MSGGLRTGVLVYVRYKDHSLFRNAPPETQVPIVQEAVGWVDDENSDYLRLIVARYHEPGSKRTVLKTTGLVIVKSTILEMRRIG